MDTIRTMWKTVAVALACGGLRADLVTLRNSDGCAVGSGATDLNRGTPSFTTFNAYTDGAGNLWGWDNDAAPAAGHDYLVSGHNQMIALLEEGVVQSFAGDSLTLDRGVVYCANAAKDTSGKIAGWIDFPSLTMKCGAIYPNGNYLNSLKVTGSIAVDGSSHGYEVGFPYASGNRWQQKGVGFHSASSQVGLMTDIAATVTSSEQDTLCVSGLHDPCLYHGNKEVYRMAVGAYVYNMRLSGDFSGFRGRVLTAPKVNLTIDRADFGGSVTLSNIASLAVGPSIPALRVSGDMELVDGWIDLQPGKTIEVGGSLSSSFADPATFVTEDGVNTYNGKGFDAATGYSRHEIEADDMAEGYNGTPQWKAWNHSRSWVRRTFRNAICIGYDEYAVEANVGSPLSAPATLAATAATLDATLVRSWVDGSVLRVGDLTLDGATLDYSNKSFVLAVTNSLTILSPVRLVLPEGWTQVKIMTDDMGEAAKAKAKTLAGKKAMQDLAETLRAKLVGRYAGRSDSSSPEIVTYNRRWKDVDYLFAVNDRRTFGDYLGQWGRTMEKGLPMAGFVTMRDSARSVKAVYELSRREKVPFTREGDSVKVPVSYDTCDGRLFAFLHQEIASVDLSCRREGDRIAVTMRVLDAGGRPVHALLPVEVRVHSSDGVEIDGAGYLVAEDGVARISVLTNRDDPKGGYRVTCRDLLTGNTRNVTVGGQPGMAPPPAAKAVPPARPAPRPVQLRRIADGIERYGIVHWGLNTFTDREWGFGDENPADLNPAKFDADQIVGACAAGGLQGLIVVAKHHDGFCLWPTKTTEHNITKSPFRGGNGDYVKEMEQACRRHGLRFGVYVSPWDRNNAHYGTDRYVTDVFQRQIRELLSGDYGEVFEMWFDGANGGDGYYGGAREKRKIPLGYYRYATETFAMVRALQPNACIFNEMDEADFRYGGNERGFVDPDSRSTGGHYDHVWKNYKKWSNAGLVDGTTFHPVEADFPLRPGWFYHAGEKGRTKSAAYLMKLYLGTVGNAATMNVGVAPNRDGLLDDEDVRALAGFGQLRRLFFSREAKDGEPFNLVVMTEDVSAGERVDCWRLVADGKALLSGRSIGIKRIRTLGSPVTAAKVEVAAESAVGAVGKIGIARYLVDPSLLKEVLSSTTESGETDTAKWMTACSLTPGG